MLCFKVKKRSIFLGFSICILWGAFLVANNLYADPVNVDRSYCNEQEAAIGSSSGCESTTSCFRIDLGSDHTCFNERSYAFGPSQSINNCTSTEQTTSRTDTVTLTIGHSASDFWQFEGQAGVGNAVVGATIIGDIGGETGTNVATSQTISHTYEVKTPAGKKVTICVYVVLIDFQYRHHYRYEYSRVDASQMGIDGPCICSSGSSYNCNGVPGSTYTAVATGTKIKSGPNVSYTEAKAEGCGG
ncbi:MAG: hypothetical protein Q4G68_05010 [Planctomycetia bacterium]|nr:hypothetical protein [Planctomycetia bacterium]